MSADLALSVDVDAPAELVWAMVTDWESQGDWMLGTQVRALDSEPGVGQRLHAVTGVAGRGVVDTMVVTEWEPPWRCTVEHTGRIVRGPGAFEVIPLGPERCRFIWSEELDLPLGAVGRFGWRFVAPAFSAGVQASLDRLAVLAAQRHRSGR